MAIPLPTYHPFTEARGRVCIRQHFFGGGDPFGDDDSPFGGMPGGRGRGGGGGGGGGAMPGGMGGIPPELLFAALGGMGAPPSLCVSSGVGGDYPTGGASRLWARTACT